MSSPYLAEIRIFPFTYAPAQWAFCNGQLMSITQNTALFSLLGTYYGGDGKSTFGLPNLQGKFPITSGQGGSLSGYQIGQTGGTTTVTLNQTQMAGHTHTGYANTAGSGSSTAPGGNYFLQVGGRGSVSYFGPDSAAANMANGAVNQVGGNQPHNNMPLYLTLNYCICLMGIYPQRS